MATTNATRPTRTNGASDQTRPATPRRPADGDPATPRHAALAARLRATGQRVTPQRLAILAAVPPGEHLSAEQVLARVAPTLPGVNRSTVFRTLELFRDLGLVSETDLGGGVRQFELLDGRHHHLVCHGCRHTQELDDALVRPLRKAIRDRYGFAAAVDHLALFGRCAACRRAPDASAAQ